MDELKKQIEALSRELFVSKMTVEKQAQRIVWLEQGTNHLEARLREGAGAVVAAENAKLRHEVMTKILERQDAENKLSACCDLIERTITFGQHTHANLCTEYRKLRGL